MLVFLFLDSKNLIFEIAIKCHPYVDFHKCHKEQKQYREIFVR